MNIYLTVRFTGRVKEWCCLSGGLAGLVYRILDGPAAKSADQETLLIALSALNLAGILTALDLCSRDIAAPVRVTGAGTGQVTDTGGNLRAVDFTPALPGHSTGCVLSRPELSRGAGVKKRERGLPAGKESGTGKTPAGTGSGRTAPRVIRWAGWDEKTKPL
jgi:hypothetical protein